MKFVPVQSMHHHDTHIQSSVWNVFVGWLDFNKGGSELRIFSPIMLEEISK
jgi:hypothetical protein